LKQRKDYDTLLDNMKKFQINSTELKKDDNAFGYLV
jgi:threonine dehydratase